LKQSWVEQPFKKNKNWVEQKSIYMENIVRRSWRTMNDQNVLMHVEHLGNNFYINTSNPPFILITLLGQAISRDGPEQCTV